MLCSQANGACWKHSNSMGETLCSQGGACWKRSNPTRAQKPSLAENANNRRLRGSDQGVN